MRMPLAATASAQKGSSKECLVDSGGDRNRNSTVDLSIKIRSPNSKAGDGESCSFTVEGKEAVVKRALAWKTFENEVYQLLKDDMERNGSKARGVLMHDLMNIYFEKFHRRLNFDTEFGFNLLGDLCDRLSFNMVDQVYVGEHIYLKAQPEIREKLQAEISKPILKDEFFGVHNLIRYGLPNSVSAPGDVIPIQSMKEDEGDVIEVCLTEITRDGDFYFQLRSNRSKVDKLMDDLETFYCDTIISDDFKIPYFTRDLIGLHVAALYTVGEQGRRVSEGWHRAVILGFVDLTTFRVFYFDYGTLDVVSLRHLRLLKMSFATLPKQALAGKVDELVMFKNGVRKLRNVAALSNRNKGGFIAVINKVYPKGIFGLTLIDTSTNFAPNGINVNELLVTEKLAERVKKEEDGNNNFKEDPAVQIRTRGTGCSNPEQRQLPLNNNDGDSSEEENDNDMDLEVYRQIMKARLLRTKAWVMSQDLSQIPDVEEKTPLGSRSSSRVPADVE